MKVKKLLRIFIVLALCFSSIPIMIMSVTPVLAQAPDIEWSNTFGGSNFDYSATVRQTSDGGYIIAGYTESYGAGAGDVWLIKTDSGGNEIWNKTFGGSNLDRGNDVCQTSDGGYIIAGYTASYGAGLRDVWLIKTDSSGIETWNKTFGGSGYDHGAAVQQTSDGGYIIAGHTESYGAGSGDLWLIKTDASGIETWNKTFGGSSDEHSQSVQQTSDGGYIILGNTYSYGAGDEDAWLIKTDSSGNEIWNQTYGGAVRDYASAIEQTSDGGYILAGSTFSYGTGGGDLWLIKTDSSGTETWSQTYGGIDYDWGDSVQQVFDGGYVVTGGTYSYGAGQNDLYLIRTDSSGNDLWNNKTLGGADRDAGLSVRQTSDGGYVIAGYTESYGAGDADVWLMKFEGRLRIAFTSDRDGNGDIYMMDADGSNQARLSSNSVRVEQPVWSPDGNKIAFDYWIDGNAEIYVMDADGSNQARLTFDSAVDHQPAWSPDSSKIIFSSRRHGSDEIYVMNPDGSNQVRLTTNSANDRGPVYSPDGTKIAFYSDRDDPAHWEVYMMDADGSNQARLTYDPANAAHPAWSPDGSQIAFHSDRDGNYEIYLMNSDGTFQTRLTNSFGDDIYPAWSPDGSRIAFHSQRDGNAEIYVMNADGSMETNLTNNPAEDSFPAWGNQGSPIPNQIPNQPSNTSPTNGATGVSLTPTLTSSGFSDPDVGDTHLASQWQITTTSGDYTSTVYNSAIDLENKESIPITAGTLNYGIEYFWHVRHQDNHEAWSDWSTETSFTTTSGEIPTQVLSPVLGSLEVKSDGAECSGTIWCFNQHQSGGHIPGGGIGQADDSFAWDANLNCPAWDSDNGRPVYAVATGVVAGTYGSRTNAGGSYGQLLIEHSYQGNEWWSGYIHLENIQVAVGQPVTDSTILGYVSNISLDAIPNHLHFIVYTGTNTLGGLESFNTAIIERQSVDGGTNTPIGCSVPVAISAAVVTFDSVILDGTTSCTTQQGNPGGGMPEGFRVRGQFVDITTTASYDKPGVQVCIPYDPSEPNPQNLKIFHDEGGHWVDVTTHVDTGNHLVCGYVTSLSWFFIGGEWVWIDDATGVPVFPTWYIGIAAALGTGILAYVLRRRALGRKSEGV